MGEYLQVLTTVANRGDADRIARALTERRLAACVQVVGPISSTYWWKGSLETVEEYICIIKTRAALYSELENAIKALHPYETPEIIATEIVAGSKAYLEWLDGETRGGK